jgi:hypothetical protein
VDADEVVLRFVAGFDAFLRDHALYLDLVNYRLHGNVRRTEDGTAVLDVEVTALLEEFRCDLDSLEPVDGAVDALKEIAQRAHVVVLSNVTRAQATARSRNLAACGLDFPLVCNSGPKGPAVRDLCAHTGRPSFFVDDIGPHLASVAEFAPHVFRIHLVGDERLKSILPICEHAQLRAQNWKAVTEFIVSHLDEPA